MECSSTSFYFCERQPLQHWAMMKPLQAGDSAHPQLLRSSLSAMSRTAKCQMLNHKRFDFEKFEGGAYDRTYGDTLFDGTKPSISANIIAIE